METIHNNIAVFASAVLRDLGEPLVVGLCVSQLFKLALLPCTSFCRNALEHRLMAQ